MVHVDAIKVRAKVLHEIRGFFDARGFIEVETPVRLAAPAPEPHIDCPIVPVPPSGGRTTFLRASPELQMKKLLAAGMERIYQIGPCFREGESGRRHNPEFTMLEWYRAHANYMDILSDMESLILHFFPQPSQLSQPSQPSQSSQPSQPSSPLVKSSPLLFPFPRITVREAYRRWAGWDPFSEWDADRFDFDMAVKIEPNMPKGPVFLMDYPPQAASLAKLRDGVAERWELYMDGIELANAFTELGDPVEQRRRFEEARAERRILGEADYPLDEDFLSSLADMPPAGGVALGVDRLVMLVCGESDIAAVRIGE